MRAQELFFTCVKELVTYSLVLFVVYVETKKVVLMNDVELH